MKIKLKFPQMDTKTFSTDNKKKMLKLDLTIIREETAIAFENDDINNQSTMRGL